MEEIVSKLHDLFAALRKDSKQFIAITEPKLAHPNNDYERMILRKALGFEKDRATALKYVKKQLSSWFNEDSFTLPTEKDQLQLYADVQLEQFKLRLFQGHVEDALTLSEDGHSKKELTAILERAEQFEHEVSACLTELKEEVVEEFPTEASEAQAINHRMDKPVLSVGSLIGQ